MSEPGTQPAAAQKASQDAVRIVLFGPPDAGKSALLGALAQAAQSQQHILNGRLIDLSQGLADLRQRLYQGRPLETHEAITSYPVTLEPNPAGPEHGTAPVHALLLDCDGRAATELLARQSDLQANGALARAILEADTLVLVVDAAAEPARLEREFSQFARFLELLEVSRGRRSDVGGLPVYLVLTKCDLLAGPNDTAVVWIDRIEEQKRQVGARFREFLARPTDGEPMPFGSIDLHLWATAIKRPALVDTPAKPREPYGVAELFRQCLASAHRFDVREDRAKRRLEWLVLGSAGLLAALAALALFLFLNRSSDTVNPLDARVDGYRIRVEEQTPDRRFRDLENNIAELESIVNKDRAAFEALPPEKQQYVRDELRKLKAFQAAYRDYVNELEKIMQPRDATSYEQLDQIEKALRKLKPPEPYQAEWAATPAGRIPEEWQNDIELLRAKVDEARDWYRKLSGAAKQVIDTIDAGNVTVRAQKVLNQANNPPFPENDPNKRLPGAATVTYGTVYNFTTVGDARQRWESNKRRLQMLVKSQD
jgi:GTPase SAR1 family protein